MKKQVTELEKISANHLSDKGLVSRISKELSKLKNETNNSIFLMSKRFEETLHQKIYRWQISTLKDV